MTFDELRARVDYYLATGDTNEPVLATAERDRFCHEAYFEVFAGFYEGFQYSNDLTISTGQNVSLISSTSSGVSRGWIAIEACEVKVGSNYIPLKRGSYGSMLTQAAGEGASATPQEYGIAIFTRSNTVLQFRVAVYPIPDNVYSIRFRLKAFPVELSAGTDLLVLEPVQCEYTARLAASRAGAILGYSDEWLEGILLPMPAEFQSEMVLVKELLWPETEPPRQIGTLRDGI